MNKRKFFLLFILIFFNITIIFAESFVFKYEKGSKYNTITTSNVDVYINDEFDHSIETLYKIRVDITDVKENSGYLSGVYNAFEKASRKDTLYQLVDEDIMVAYWCDSSGKYSAPSEQLLPEIRDLPIFPDKELTIGDTWEAQGKEIFDMRIFGFNKLIPVPLNATYIYVKNETINNVKCAIFRIYYSFSLNLIKYANINNDSPFRITGYSTQQYVFDIKNGRPYSYEDTFSSMNLFTNGDVYEFKGKSKCQVIEWTQLDKDKIVKDIQDIIDKEGITDTTVRKEADGVTITIEDINFEPDSNILKPIELEKLKKIGSILKNYPERNIFIGGHTALAGTEAGRNLLSKERAWAVGNYLLKLGVCKDTQLMYKGYGATMPIGDNDSIEGMRKNRRVEIKILEN